MSFISQIIGRRRMSKFINCLVGVLFVLVGYTVFLDVSYPFQDNELFEQDLNVSIEQKRRWNVIKRRTDFRKNDTNTYCDIYNVSRPYTADFECVKTKTHPSTTVCIYPESSDVYISHDIKDTGKWEPHVINDFQEILRINPHVGVIDLGANIGFYSLIAAKMGHHVVAIEPYYPSIHRLHRAVQIEGLSDRVTVIHNAIADRRTLGSIRINGENQGDTRVDLDYHHYCIGDCPPPVNTILMDDLLEVIPFNSSIIKVDIQGYECQAFAHASKLLDKLHVPYIFMEWGLMPQHYQTKNHTSGDKYRIQEMIRMFFDRDYRPYSLSNESNKALNANQWQKWPFDIIWRKKLNKEEKEHVLRSIFIHWPLT